MREANGSFWLAMRTELARRGIDAPGTLDFARQPVPGRIETDTLFTQVCGWPLQTIYAGQAVILGVPLYDAPHCDGPHHAGVFVVRDASRYAVLEDLRGCEFVFNSVHSNSGMNMPRRAIAPIADGQAFFGAIRETHSQPGNLERVANGEADATCVDCVTYALFVRHRSELGRRLRVLTATPPCPAIPFVTAMATEPALRSALSDALTQVARAPEWAAARAGLLLRDVAPATAVDYLVQPGFEAEARALGYPVLR